MYQVLFCLTDQHDWRLVALGGAVCLLASAAAISLFHRARAANGGALPPDMSVLAKARGYERGFPYFITDMIVPYQEAGPDYIAALVTGY